ncbi:type IV toxin-antitoxin system AbiEi family antitoxin domain-containing protein [Phytoactinopolyspora limicola]|uniref:type IV toxin-antitoxin system AbiEi family antitoxin domain-containing protein n=1 Tax=Phytoactinopolyspora limicola TaxID=2715536 RepID=UPI00140DEAD7|nr:type IV toxin-antitoxin system AbiEi family antitoxin domain-containing protein [Phytoactinopolyspora limicola]
MAFDRIEQLALLQDGIVCRWQLLRAGLSPRAIEHRLRDGGPWRRIVRGVYATFTGPLSDLHKLRAAILYAGPGARIAGAWACWMHGLSYGPARDARIVVLVPWRSRRSSSGFVQLTRIVAADDGWHNWVDSEAVGDVGRSIAMAYDEPDELAGGARTGVIPMASPARAVINTVTKPFWLPAAWQATCPSGNGCPVCQPGRGHAVTALRNVRALLCEVVQTGQCSVADLAKQLDSTGRRHTALARRVLDDLEAGCRSAPECELRDLIATSRVLPPPRWNQPLPGTRGLYPDACWPDARLVVEVDSRAFHGFGDAPERTERRRARYAALGWLVVPVAPRRIREEPAVVLRELEGAYLAGRRR